MSTPVLECRDLTCGYDRQPVLSHVDLSIARGEIIALLGGSGAGKSTLVRTMIGLQAPIAGQVFLLGENIHELPPRRRDELLRRVGLLFQHDALLASSSLAENVGLPIRQHTDLPEVIIDEIVRMKLAAVGLAGLEGRLPDQVSGGQRKRAALARAAALDPELIFLDEPTSGLDPVAAAGIEDLFLRFRDSFGISMVIVTHVLETIRRTADRAIMVGRGRILADGTIAELEASDEPTVRAFFRRVAAQHGGGGRTVLEQLEQSPSSGASND